MSIRNPDYLPLLATGAITPNRIIKMGTADQSGALATAATDKIVGISVAAVTAASGETFDVCVDGEYELIAGGTIARGDKITSDAAGAGVTAAPSAGANNGIVGYAMDSAVAGDIFTVNVEPAQIQG